MTNLRDRLMGLPATEHGLGDNLAIALCSYYESRLDCPEDGEMDDSEVWKGWAVDQTERMIDRIISETQEGTAPLDLGNPSFDHPIATHRHRLGSEIMVRIVRKTTTHVVYASAIRESVLPIRSFGELYEPILESDDAATLETSER